MTMASLIDVQDCLNGLDLTAKAQQVDYLLGVADQVIKDYTHREFELQTWVETIDGPGHPFVFLRHTPVTVVTSVVEDGVTLTGTQYKTYAKQGKLVRVSGDSPIAWTWKLQGVVVTYTAGYAEIPASVSFAAASMVAQAIIAGATGEEAFGSGGVNLERIGDYMVQTDLRVLHQHLQLSPADKAILGPYRRTIIR